MHIEPEPQEWYMPVWANGTGVTTSFELRRKVIIEPGQSIQLPNVVISVHRGDFFDPLTLYRKLMSERRQVQPQNQHRHALSPDGVPGGTNLMSHHPRF